MKKEGHPGFAGCLFVCGGALSVTAGAVPASRLPRRVLSASGRRPAPTDAAAETGRWATSHRDVAAPEGGSQVGAPPKACRKLSLASPLGGGGLALARTERASCQRLPRMGCVEALAGCPLSRLAATAPPRGEPSLASPFGGRWCPVGTVQRLTEPAGESVMPLA